jgi:hypothetical protein
MKKAMGPLTDGRAEKESGTRIDTASAKAPSRPLEGVDASAAAND